MPPFPIRRAVGVLLTGRGHDKRRVLASVSLGNTRDTRILRTRSKAAIFLLFVAGSSFVSGSYFPTRSVAGVSSSGARSVHVVFSFGFCEVGVKKLETADSGASSISCGLIDEGAWGTYSSFRSGPCASREAGKSGRRRPFWTTLSRKSGEVESRDGLWGLVRGGELRGDWTWGSTLAVGAAGIVGSRRVQVKWAHAGDASMTGGHVQDETPLPCCTSRTKPRRTNEST